VAPVQAVAATAPRGTVVDGTVMANGRPVAGAKVTLYAWRRQSVMARLRIGQTRHLTVVGSAVSSRSGRYSVKVTNWAGLSASASQGVVNLEITARTANSSMTFSFPRRIVATANGAALAADNEVRVPHLAPQKANLNLRALVGRARPDFPPCGTMTPVQNCGQRLAKGPLSSAWNTRPWHPTSHSTSRTRRARARQASSASRPRMPTDHGRQRNELCLIYRRGGALAGRDGHGSASARSSAPFPCEPLAA
jgi:hypothetical protein